MLSATISRAFLSSLQIRIAFVVVALVLGGVWAYALLVAERQEQRLQTLLATQQANVLGYVADHIDSVVRLRLESLALTATTIPADQLHDREKLVATLAARPILKMLFNSGVILARPDGIGAFADYPTLPGRSEIDFSSLDSFQHVLFDGTPAMGQPFRGRFLEKGVVTFAAPIFDGRKEIAAVLIGITTLDEPNFLDLINKGLPQGGGDMVVVAPGTEPVRHRHRSASLHAPSLAGKRPEPRPIPENPRRLRGLPGE